MHSEEDELDIDQYLNDIDVDDINYHEKKLSGQIDNGDDFLNFLNKNEIQGEINKLKSKIKTQTTYNSDEQAKVNNDFFEGIKDILSSDGYSSDEDKDENANSSCEYDDKINDISNQDNQTTHENSHLKSENKSDLKNSNKIDLEFEDQI